jgi:hypothetical protein
VRTNTHFNVVISYEKRKDLRHGQKPIVLREKNAPTWVQRIISYDYKAAYEKLDNVENVLEKFNYGKEDALKTIPLTQKNVQAMMNEEIMATSATDLVNSGIITINDAKTLIKSKELLGYFEPVDIKLFKEKENLTLLLSNF